MTKNLAFRMIIVSIILTVVTAGSAFYLFRPKNTVSPLPKESKNFLTSKTLPSKTLKEYTDDSGFSFKYSEDVVVVKKEVKDSSTYADLELNSTKAQGNILIKIEDTKLESFEDWLLENKLTTTSAAVKDIKLGDLSGWETKLDNKLIALSLDQHILFTIEVISYDKYWLDVYNTILSSFSFVAGEATSATEGNVSDVAGDDIILEEETIE